MLTSAGALKTTLSHAASDSRQKPPPTLATLTGLAVGFGPRVTLVALFRASFTPMLRFPRFNFLNSTVGFAATKIF